MKLIKVTITGADESVTANDLFQIWRKRRFVEWGILRSKKRQGKPRYPNDWLVSNFINRGPFVSFAGHLCGEWACDAVEGPFLWAIEHNEEWQGFNRIQINVGVPSRARFQRVIDLALRTGKPIIVQIDSMERLREDAIRYMLDGACDPLVTERVHFLLDASGGTGKPLTEFKEPPTGVDNFIGYAGGINPDNVRDVLTRLTALPGDRPFWIDVESGVRSEHNDRSIFDKDKVLALLDIASEFVEKTT